MIRLILIKITQLYLNNFCLELKYAIYATETSDLSNTYTTKLLIKQHVLMIR